MRFGSVCSGIEAASVASEPLGWEAAWFSEIEPFPCAVLAHHFPDVNNLGDMMLLPDRILSGEVDAPDVFVGGTPCQAFSFAGKRESLDDERGLLTLKYVEIADAIDEVRADKSLRPSVIFWENVPGVLNTSDNAFGCFIAALVGENTPIVPSGGKWPNAGMVVGPRRSLAWRVLDAQYFGLAQRRKRVFVVASADKNFSPAEVLFERKGVSRNTKKGREAGEETTRSLAYCADVAPTVLNGPLYSRTGNDRVECDALVVPKWYRMTAFGEYVDDNTASTAKARDYKDATDLVLSADVYNGAISDVGDTFGANSGQSNTAGGKVVVPCILNDQGGSFIQAEFSETMPTIRAHTRGHEPSIICDNIPSISYAKQQGIDIYNMKTTGDIACCVTKETGGSATHSGPSILCATAVRRITPTEAERLQGFPDDYTAIPYRGKSADECPDGPRYKAIGNSWAVNCVRWIFERIDKEHRR